MNIPLKPLCFIHDVSSSTDLNHIISIGELNFFLFFFVRWENKIKNMNNIEEFEKELEKLAKKIQQEVDECRDADLTDWIKEEIKIFIQKWEA